MLTITPELKSYLIENKLADANMGDEHYRQRTGEAIVLGRITAEKLRELGEKSENRVKGLITDAVREAINPAAPGGIKLTSGSGPNPADVYGGIRVKAGSERYCETKSIGKHEKFGFTPAYQDGRQATTSSELERAKAGAFLKFTAKKAGLDVVMSDHERDLMEDSFQKDRWVGLYDKHWHKDLSGLHCKTLINDSASGGVNVVPEWFDANLITFPLLSGELYPFVNVVDVPRGSSVEGASISNPSLTWGTNEPTAIPLFDTDSMIAPINTSIHTVSVSLEVGKDFLADAAADIGNAIMQVIGEKFKAELDNVISNGNGTNRPEGIFVASGVGSVTTGGTWGIDDVEALLFGIGKQYRQSSRCAFISNDTTYGRIRALPTGIASDNQRLFGADHESYRVLARSWKIQNDLANTKAAFGDLGRYRLYRRLGFQLEWVTQGATLARANTVLLVARGRFGGRVVDPSAFTVATDAPA